MTGLPGRIGLLMSRLPPVMQRFVRFAIVGGTTSLMYVGLVYLLAGPAGLPPWLASATSYVSLLPVNYFGQKLLAFRSTDRHGVALPKYLFVHATGILGSSAIMQFMSRVLEVDLVYGAAVATAFIPVLTFIAFNFWVFVGTGDRRA